MDPVARDRLIDLVVGRNEAVSAGHRKEARDKHERFLSLAAAGDITIGLPAAPPVEDAEELFWMQETVRMRELRDAEVSHIRGVEHKSVRTLLRERRIPRRQTAISSALRTRSAAAEGKEAEALRMRAEVCEHIDHYLRERDLRRCVRRRLERTHAYFADKEARRRWDFEVRLKEIESARPPSRRK